MAAIARCRGAAIATRNVGHFERCGIEVINPWTAMKRLSWVPDSIIGLIGRKCKPLVEVDFPIAKVPEHMVQGEGTPVRGSPYAAAVTDRT